MVAIQPVSVAAPAPAPALSRCVAIGQFVNKEGCYALQQSDGVAIWLEMDRIPMHLIDRQVRIEGIRYQANLISVESVGPA